MTGTIPSPGRGRNSPQPARIAGLLVRKSRAEQDCLEGRSERPATGMGSPERDANREGTQVDNLCYEWPREGTQVENLCYGGAAPSPCNASRFV